MIQDIIDTAAQNRPSTNGVEELNRWLNDFVVTPLSSVPGRRDFGPGEVDFCNVSLVIGQFPTRDTCESDFLPIGGFVTGYPDAEEYGLYTVSGKHQMTNGGFTFNLLPNALDAILDTAAANKPATFEEQKIWFNNLVLAVDNFTGDDANRFNARSVYGGVGSLNWNGYDTNLSYACQYQPIERLSVPGYAGFFLFWGNWTFANPSASFPDWEYIQTGIK
ncbi:hypothetical protein A2334_00700 [Candidatus Roizmanbacteria bacterium RIFOXYB2_FULL_38_10]|uniref:Uncharacterized protein n=1 Tax=Candidatus Roizmanbacteria bacterium RIFOXYD1_FULL_38_12 TaxID=1802093 RepID=A0A1F7L1A7_9BACT|nr:MAG: hypothetical protein A3K47_03970 [Candidatus Roizmanbacteria bacterium RIFOXYA2_FULL_38_14]OGK63914.1 MAG: hypothetical protein A3K27_03970 [Candidatus Roizmanbacteria bacterium RIFOXYA1_FULL_37_12]OGK65760.1 MAG: hypothetical protein A3K38_03970 [Candidatus Roizmanbacteria bacterium RIFOXYB1_FULL_40_23]OGK68204.1 MAG: hypothetical protein A2334_00700 [Candidatus Roizmanbacteria bacterium RIFOXYB2_FULL_38_10]OGK70165.1 MAG: hypothetical protein A3K21_03975 [Candidatus Roizmanbacteria ba